MLDVAMCRQLATGPITNMMLMFEFAGGWRDVKGSVAVTVLQYLLGGGGSFSAGGPGTPEIYKIVIYYLHFPIFLECSSPACAHCLRQRRMRIQTFAWQVFSHVPGVDVGEECTSNSCMILLLA